MLEKWICGAAITTNFRILVIILDLMLAQREGYMESEVDVKREVDMEREVDKGTEVNICPWGGGLEAG